MSNRPRIARLRTLGDEVRRIRTRAGLTLDEAVPVTGADRSTLIAIERAQRRPQRRTLKTILEKLDASPEEIDALLAVLASSKDVWLRDLRDLLPKAYGDYIDLESQASAIRWYEPLLVPGLLQTEPYAYAHTLGAVPQATAEQIKTHVDVRMERQRAFAARAPHLWVITTEAALRYQVGGPDVVREQLARLLETSKAANITLQVIPFSAGAHRSMTSGFGLLDFEGSKPLVYQENPAGQLLLEDPGELTVFRQVYADLQATALSPAATSQLITDVMDQIERREAHDGRIAMA